MKIGLLHPGEMGGAIGGALVDAGKEVHWASAGRSPETRARAAAARLIDDVNLATLLEETDLVISVCPPHAAIAIAEEVAAASGKRNWIYLDANAVAPATARRVARTVEVAGAHYVDGGIIGPPPVSPGSTRLYVSGPRASAARDSLLTDRLDTRIMDDQPTSASALKLAYAAWTKGSSALLLAARAAAANAGIEDTLLAEWSISQPGLGDRWEGARRAALEKGWRWSGEMKEVASMFDELGLPPGFHTAAAEVFEDPATFGCR